MSQINVESIPIRFQSVDQPAPPREAGIADTVLSPLDGLHDSLAGNLSKLDRTLERRTAKVPLLRQVVEFGSGAGGAIAGMAEGMWQTVRHPLAAIQGLWTLASHVPLTPMWLWRGARNGVSNTLIEDKQMWKALGSALWSPYKRDIDRKRYFAVAGRAAVDIGMIYLTARQVQRSYQGWKAQQQNAKLAGAGLSPAGEDGLRAAVLGTEPNASGQVLGEGQLMIKGERGRKMMQRFNREAKAPGLPARPGTRAQLERAASRYAGDRKLLREKAIAQLSEDRANFMRINRVGPDRLRSDYVVQKRYRLLTESVDLRVDQELGELLGHHPVGLPKDPMRAAAKLEMMRDSSGKALRLGNMEDLARGRINLSSLDVPEMQRIMAKLKQHYGRENLIIHDYISGKPFYRGRLHVKIRDGSGLWYELQVGPKQISQFYDTPFKIGKETVNIHDAVYKGLLRMDEAAIRAVGKGNYFNGELKVAKVLDMYIDQVDAVEKIAKAGKAFDFGETATLRRAIANVVKDVPEALLPVGLR